MRGLVEAEDGTLFDWQADSSSHMASTTKSFTLLLAVEAVVNGIVSLDDLVTISTKAATINNNHPNAPTHSSTGFTEGENIRFEDLLYAMMLDSAGDASIAIAQHVAVSSFPSIADDTDSQQEQEFTDMMNNRAVELGLTDTEFFNAYGGPHVHEWDNTAGTVTTHRATPRDMARWFHYGMQYELFRDVAGFQGDYDFTAFGATLDVVGAAYSLNKNLNIPGLQGSKPGGGGGCISCWILEARRINRDIVTGYTQDQSGDGTTLLNYGFAELFHPKMAAESNEWAGGWLENDVTAVTADLAASVVVQANGTLRILLWDVDLDDEGITHLNPYSVPKAASGFAVPTNDPAAGTKQPISYTIERSATGELTTRDSGPSITQQVSYATQDYTAQVAGDTKSSVYKVVSSEPPPPTRPGDITIYDPPTVGPHNQSVFFEIDNDILVENARIISAEFGNLVVIADTSDGVFLYLYGITIQRTVFLRDTQFVGTGSEGRVHKFKSSLIITGHRQNNGFSLLQTWNIDPELGTLSSALDSYSGPAVSELELTGLDGSEVHLDLVVASISSGTPTLRNYTIHNNTGEITTRDSITSGTGSAVAISRLRGFESRDIYALVYRDNSARLVVQSYEIDGNWQLAQMASTTDNNAANTLAASVKIKIAALDKQGVMVALQADATIAEQRLEVWAFDTGLTSDVIQPARISTETIMQDGLHALSRIPGDDAEGDFLLVPGAYALDGIKVQAWRSAPRH